LNTGKGGERGQKERTQILLGQEETLRGCDSEIIAFFSQTSKEVGNLADGREGGKKDKWRRKGVLGVERNRLPRLKSGGGAVKNKEVARRSGPRVPQNRGKKRFNQVHGPKSSATGQNACALNGPRRQKERSKDEGGDPKWRKEKRRCTRLTEELYKHLEIQTHKPGLIMAPRACHKRYGKENRRIPGSHTIGTREQDVSSEKVIGHNVGKTTASSGLGRVTIVACTEGNHSC